MEEVDMWEEVAMSPQPSRVASLLDLNPHQREREELRAAGVSAHRVEALYPSGLESVLPSLLSLMARVPSTDLMHLCYADSQVNSIFYARESRKIGSGWHETNMPNRFVLEAYTQASKEDAAFAELYRYLLKCFENPGGALVNVTPAEQAAKVLWCTHWLQVHRHELKPEYAAVATALDARVCDILGITAA
jgi:hypothetical protein